MKVFEKCGKDRKRSNGGYKNKDRNWRRKLEKDEKFERCARERKGKRKMLL